MAVTGASASRNARTGYKVLGSGDGAALVLCDLHTGRTHQVRVHMRSIGHPILGDPAYMNAASERLNKKLNVERLCLHAWTVAFDSPAGGRVEVKAPLPESFKKVLGEAGISAP